MKDIIREALWSAVYSDDWQLYDVLLPGEKTLAFDTITKESETLKDRKSKNEKALLERYNSVLETMVKRAE